MCMSVWSVCMYAWARVCTCVRTCPCMWKHIATTYYRSLRYVYIICPQNLQSLTHGKMLFVNFYLHKRCTNKQCSWIIHTCDAVHRKMKVNTIQKYMFTAKVVPLLYWALKMCAASCHKTINSLIALSMLFWRQWENSRLYISYVSLFILEWSHTHAHTFLLTSLWEGVLTFIL